MLVFILSDFIAVLTAAVVGYVGWLTVLPHRVPFWSFDLLPILFVFPIAFGLAGLYPGFGLGAVETLRRLSQSTSVVFLVLVFAMFTLKVEEPRGLLATVWLLALGLVPLARFLTYIMVKGRHWWGEPSVVIGTSREAENVIRSVKNAFSLGYTVVGGLVQGPAATASIGGVPVLGDIQAASRVSALGVRTALVWDGLKAPGVLDSLLRQFRRVVIISDNTSLPLEQLRLRNLGGVLGLEVHNELHRIHKRILKRALDLAIGVPMLLLAAPLIAVSSIAIKLVSPGPVFFGQERVGFRKRRFRVWKLRTMFPDAEHRLSELLARDDIARRSWAQSMKLKKDPRILPRVGTFLRRSSIDELPQLFNVVTGAMSLVGPRPFPEYHMDALPEDFADLRSTVRPGLTGLWQVMIRSDGDLGDQVRFDTYYIRNWSIWFDLYILARTVFAVIAGRGSH